MQPNFKNIDPAVFVSLNHPEALIEPEKLLRAYFDSPNVGLCILDSDLHYLAINQTLAEINGVPVEAHLGKTVREILGEIATPLEDKLRQLLQAKAPLSFEISGKLLSRTEKGHWNVHYFPIRGSDDNVGRIGAVVVDISAQKQLEQSLQSMGGQLQQETGRLQMLGDVSTLLSSSWNVSQVFPQISARIRRLLRHEFASLAIQDSGTGLLVHQATDFPLAKGLMPAMQVSSRNTPQAQVMQEQKPMIFTQEQLRQFDDHVARGMLAEGLQALCCVPLMRPHGPLGVVLLGSTRPAAFQDNDLELINQVATQLAIAIENHRAAAEIENLKRQLGEERSYLQGETKSEGQFPEIVGNSPALKCVLDQVATVSSSEATVLILGDTGTGKELIAHALHRMSRRSHGPFVKVNCAAIPTGLLESELFGHEKGAFTGAIMRKIGRIELANGGTLFLDEVGEIPVELQPKLLRVLQEQEFERLGSNRTIKVNLRIIAATNRNLEEGIARHEFRSDLFYRLHVFPIRLPSLRERHDDIPLLIRHFVQKFARRMERHIETIPKETMEALTHWDWPGNVRELENLMERSVILSEGSALRVPLGELSSPSHRGNQPADETLDEAEKLHIIRVLRETKGVISGAAKRLGLKRTTLQSKMQRLKIQPEDYRGSEE